MCVCGARHHVRRVGEVRHYVRYVGRQGAMSGMRKVRRHVRYVEGQGAMSGVWEGNVPCQVCGKARCHVTLSEKAGHHVRCVGKARCHVTYMGKARRHVRYEEGEAPCCHVR